jgi:hypothetical protein
MLGRQVDQERPGTMMEPVARGGSIPGRTGDQSAANGGSVLII